MSATSATPGRPLRIGFVNNMPDAAFHDTYRQFRALIHGARSRGAVEMHCYVLQTVPRSEEVLGKTSPRYENIDRVFDDKLDALVVTGTEPHSADLRDEPYWEELSGLLVWAEASIASTVLSCLASHAAALAIDGIQRKPLPVKRSGVFVQEVDTSHPLGEGLPPVASFPHSRLNDIPTADITSAGFRPVIWSHVSGWTVATRERDGRRLTLLQGHPEYGRTTLLREFRRDMRRYSQGVYRNCPPTPTGYFDRYGLRILAESRDGEFPYDLLEGHISADWGRLSEQLFANWVADARVRAAVAVPHRYVPESSKVSA